VSDFTLPPRSTLIVGMTGSGKTTFGIRYLLNAPGIACRFIFDDTGQMAARLKISHAGIASELEAAIQTRWVVFNPHRMFPGDAKRAFGFFCDWAFQVSRRGRGRKIFFADEIWRWQDRDNIPRDLAVLSQMGRAENIELVTATQQPSLVNASITGSATELVCFRLQESVELLKVKRLGANETEVSLLPRGQFISYNRLTGDSVRGGVF
jgi:hypothetical protein